MRLNEKAAFKNYRKRVFCLTCKLVPRILVVCFVFLAQGVFISAQTANPPQPMKLDAAIELALTNYPAIKTTEVCEANASTTYISLF